MNTRRITYTAVCAALAAMAVIVCAYTPVNIVPLIFYSAAVYISFCAVGAWGLITAVVALAIAFFVSGGFSDTFVLTAVLFTPYAILAFLLRKLNYFDKKKGIVRGVVMFAFFVLEAYLMLLLARFLTGVDLTLIVDKIGVWALFVLFAAVSIPTDFFFSFATDKILKMTQKYFDGQ